MIGVDPIAYLQQVALKMDDLLRLHDIETVLDEVEYLFEAIPPELQEPAEVLIEQLRRKLADAKRWRTLLYL